MSTTTALITIDPVAAARLDELGLRDEVNDAIEFTQATVPSLHSIKVEPCDDESEPEGLRVCVRVLRDAPYQRRDPVERTWNLAVIDGKSQHFLRWVATIIWPKEVYGEG